jgi:16S rRNA (cytosine1402-N4)-methyltransferase
MNDGPIWKHTTVLLAEAIDALLGASVADATAEVDAGATGGRVYVDGTFGRGGHSRLLLSRMTAADRLVAFDKDLEAIAAAGAPVDDGGIDDARFTICHASFADMAATLAALGIEAVQGVLLDLGISSPQIDNPARGFSFRFDAPLDMRMDTTRGESAADFLARADESQIAEVIRDYGEERFAVSIAKALVACRESGSPVRTTAELSQVVARAVKTREKGQDPATRTFQALRIHVNGELAELEQGLNAALDLLAPGGRLVVIAFHSLEDRIVKTFIARHSKAVYDRRAPFAAPVEMRLNALSRIKPGETEVRANGRSRSAIMRVAERTSVGFAAGASA